MRKLALPVLGLLTAVLVTGSNAYAVVAVAAPAGNTTGFATPVVVTRVGGPLQFVNADPTLPHDFVADKVYGADGQPWCNNYPDNKCPLFWSAKIAGPAATEVRGLDKVAAGAQYGFLCTIHPTMKGTLHVLPA